MAVNIQSIQFKHLLYDESDKVVTLAKVQIQFYNVNTKSWLSLTDALKVTKGKLAHTLTIPSRISTKNQTIRVVREVLKSGGTPSFRIIEASTQKPPQVIATTFIATILTDTKLTIDFGKSWLLNPKEYVDKGDHVVIASEVPMFQFTSAIRTMEIEKDTAVAQVADLNTNLQTVVANLASEQELRQSLETQLAEQSAQIEAMEVSTGDVGAVAIERDNALAQVSGLNETITALSGERTALQTQLADAQNTIATKDQQVSDLNINLQTVTTNLDNERELRQSLEAEKANLEAEVISQRAQMESIEMANVDSANYQNLYNDLQIQVTAVNQDNSNLQQQVADITIQRDDLAQQVSAITLTNNNLQQQVSNLTITRDNLELEKVSFLASISQLQTDVQQEKALVKAKDVELRNKQTELESLQQENNKLQHDLAEAQDFSITDHPNKLSATKVLSTIVNDVNKADAELANSNCLIFH